MDRCVPVPCTSTEQAPEMNIHAPACANIQNCSIPSQSLAHLFIFIAVIAFLSPLLELVAADSGLPPGSWQVQTCLASPFCIVFPVLVPELVLTGDAGMYPEVFLHKI